MAHYLIMPESPTDLKGIYKKETDFFQAIHTANALAQEYRHPVTVTFIEQENVQVREVVRVKAPEVK